jgi:hypothetical protein
MTEYYNSKVMFKIVFVMPMPCCSKLTIPASAAGAVLGKGGSILKAISEESGAELVMNNRNDSIFTQERILTVAGTSLSV